MIRGRLRQVKYNSRVFMQVKRLQVSNNSFRQKARCRLKSGNTNYWLARGIYRILDASCNCRIEVNERSSKIK
jgi:hypothetical protein